MAVWPPTLEDLKDDEEIPQEDEVDDAALKRRLDASIRFVERVRRDLFFTAEDGVLVEPVEFREEGEKEAETVILGTLMMASRLFARRRSREAILWMAETGTTRVPFDDGDIARLLRIGRHQRMLLG